MLLLAAALPSRAAAQSSPPTTAVDAKTKRDRAILPTGMIVENELAIVDGAMIGIDYSYRTTNPFNGNHSIGIVLSL